jgi:hypothetical protein
MIEEIKLASKFDAKGFKQADTATQKLSKSAKNLGRNLGLAFGTAAILGFAKSSIRASIQAQAQQDRLAKLMKITVGASNYQIESLNNQATALEKLGVVSASNITQTQSQLATFNLQADTIKRLTPAILDYVVAEKGAAASTEQFKQMTNGLAQALNGNFASLSRTGFEIDDNTKSIIKNGTEAERTEAIVAVLDSTYKGFNASLRNTPVGQMQILNNAAEAAKTTIGTGLVDALILAGGKDANVQNVADAMANLSDYTADAIRGVGVLAAKLSNIDAKFSGGFLGRLFKKNFQLGWIGQLNKLGAEVDAVSRERSGRAFMGSSGGQGTLFDAAASAAKKAAAAAAKAAAAQTKATKALTKEQKKQLALKKAAKVFDLDQIQIIAALKGNISEEEKIRLQAQLAILNDNEGVASQLTKQILMSQDATGNLYKLWQTLPDAKNPFAYLDEWLRQFQSKLSATIASPTWSAPASLTSGASMGQPNFATMNTDQLVAEADKTTQFLLALAEENDALIGSIQRSSAYKEAQRVEVALTITGDGDLTNTIAKNLMQQSLSSGNQTYINRRTGGFE